MFEIDPRSSVSLTEQIVERISALAQQGRLQVGARLPSIRQLAKKLHVSPFTVVTAYDQLVALGKIVAHASSGFFVTGSRSASPLAVARAPDVDGPLDAVWLARSNLEINETWVAAGGESLPGSWMDDASMDCLPRKIARGNGENFRASNGVQGSPVLREALALHLKFDGIFVDPNCLVVTDCATQAVDLICRAMLRSGDLAVVEEPASPMLISHLRQHGARIVAVRRHVDGLDLEALEALCKLESPALVFTQSALHDPTGWSSSIVNLHRLLSLAERYAFTIAEDDMYGNLSQAHAARLAQLSDLNHVIYYSSFAKVMGPLVRLGFIAVAGSLVDTFINAKLHLASECSILAERAALGMLHSGKYRKHLERLRRCLSNARANALSSLTASGIRSDHSGQGIFIWGEMPTKVNMELLVRRAFAEKILLAPGYLFRLHNLKRDSADSADSGVSFYLRFNAAASHDIRLTKFLLQYTKRGESPYGDNV